MATKKPTGIKARGFASMTPEKRREVASKGGKSVDPANRSFARDRTLAVTAGALGGASVDPANRAFSQDKALASRASKIARKTDRPD